MIKQKRLATKILTEMESLRYKKLLYLKFQKTPTKINPQKQDVHGIVTVNLSNSNIIINISDLKGNCIIKSSSGLVNYKGNEKVRKYALVNIIKTLIDQSDSLNYKNLAIHFKGIKKYRPLIINLLKKKFIITIIKHRYILPHNGCRPKKAKRL
jgi:small subunit ribosomal protein S11